MTTPYGLLRWGQAGRYKALTRARDQGAGRGRLRGQTAGADGSLKRPGHHPGCGVARGR